MRYLPPAAELSGRVASFYIMEAKPDTVLDLHDYAIPVWPNLRSLLRGEITVALEKTYTFTGPPATGWLFGSTTTATHVHMTGPFKVVGASFFPLGWREIFRVPASDWANRAGALADVWGYDPAATWAALDAAMSDAEIVSILNKLFIGRVVTAKAHRAPENTAAVEHLLVHPATTTVDAIADKTGLSLRQIERISLNSYGHSPKQVIRKFRFLRTIAELSKTPNAAWRTMIDELYYDQSHFIRDFKEFTGMTPTEYQKNPPTIMRGFMHSLGTTIALQTLPATFEIDPARPNALVPVRTALGA
jgi:AraC-like DNA-binding protein